MNGPRPPRWPTAFLSALLPADDREAVVEELEELYRVQCARRGARAADRWYTRQVGVFAWKLARHGRSRGVPAGRSAFQRALYERERDGGGAGMADVTRETGRALRRLIRAPVFTAVSVATIAVGIGAFTSIFGLVEAVLLEPMPYEEPEELAWVWRDYVEMGFPRGWLGGPDIAEMRKHPDVFAGVVGLRTGAVNLDASDGSDPVRIRVHYVTHELFDLLGVPPARGRAFRAEDDVPGAPAVAVLTHESWTRIFGADPGVVGRTIGLDGETTEVVGVAPEHFRFVKHGSLSEPAAADVYVPLRLELADASPGAGSFAGLVRLRPGVHPDRLSAALGASAQVTNTYMEGFDASPIRLWTVDLTDDLVEPVRPALTALVGSAGFLLLVLAANLATLLLGRAATRERELGIRAALGAGRGRILTSVLSESLVIAGLGGAIGLVLAYLGTDLVVAIAPDDLPRLGAVGIDASVLSVAVGVTLAMALAAGTVPALQSMRASVSATMKEGDGRSGGSLRGSRTRNALVAAQVALSLMLLAGAAMTGRAFASLLRADPGFDPHSTLTFAVRLPSSAYPGDPEEKAFHDALHARLRALPGVRAVGGTTALPLTQTTNQQGISFPEAPGNTGDDQADGPLVDWFRVTPGYFEAAGHRLLAGRSFEPADGDTTTVFPIVIDDVLARRFFPGGAAVGSRARFFGDTATIVGVVDQARLYNVHGDDRGHVYVPADRFPTNQLSYAVRTDLDPTTLVPAVRGAIGEIDAAIPMSDVRTLESIVDSSLGEQRLSLSLILAFAFGSLTLATLGIYGVVSNTVVRRTQEIGVRMALGASARTVVSGLLRQGVGLSLAGAVLGLAGALLAARVVEGVMFGVEARDPLVYGAVAGTLLAVAALASYLPARRATRIDPVEALRPR